MRSRCLNILLNREAVRSTEVSIKWFQENLVRKPFLRSNVVVNNISGRVLGTAALIPKAVKKRTDNVTPNTVKAASSRH
jgi:hypothetical protein